jgi:HSP20 family protein
MQKLQQAPRGEPGRSEGARRASFTLRVDMLETEDRLVDYADMPGVRPGDVDICFENGELAVYGRCTPGLEGVHYLLQEYGPGDYYREFVISEHIDSGKITAELKNGVLTIQLPKSEAVKPRRVMVTGG